MQPAQLVVGVPYNMDGTPTALTAAARRFAAELADALSHACGAGRRALSSARSRGASCARHARAGLKRRRTTHADVDMIAARILLERWFAGEGEAHTMRAHDP